MQYKPLENGYDTEVNGIGGIIKPKGIVTVVLNLEYDTSKLYNIFFKTSTTYLERPIFSSSLKNGPGTEDKMKL